MNISTPLTICMFSNLYPPIHSGSSTQCAQLAGELARHGCKVIVITSRIDRQSAEYEFRDGVHVYRIPCIQLPRMPIALNFPWLNITFAPPNTRRILNILKIHSPDIIHLHNHMFDMAFHARQIARRLKKPLVITIHTIIMHPNRLYDLILSAIDSFLLKNLIIRQAKILISPDRIISNYIERRFKQANIRLVPYGIYDPPAPDPGKMAAIREHFSLEDGPVILSLGHLHEIRNRKELIEALPELIKRFPKLKVMIVGDIGTTSAEKLAIQLGVLDHLIFTGAVPHSEISNFLGIADIEAHWFHRSHPHRSLGIAAQEAMAAGKVVVGSADVDVYEDGVLQNGQNVILVDPNNAAALVSQIAELLDDDHKRMFVGKNAQDTARKYFSWGVVCEKTLSVYRSLLK
jgi:1,2-diacylglycerol 3-alpha-glucosyltransferase